MKTINIKFIGIDSYNRPVFKDIKEKIYYGDTEHLFTLNARLEEVLNFYNGINKDLDGYFTKQLVYFGNHFDCEPNGGALNPEKATFHLWLEDDKQNAMNEKIKKNILKDAIEQLKDLMQQAYNEEIKDMVEYSFEMGKVIDKIEENIGD